MSIERILCLTLVLLTCLYKCTQGAKQTCGPNEVFGSCKVCKKYKMENKSVYERGVADSFICSRQKCNKCSCKEGYVRIDGQCKHSPFLLGNEICGPNEVFGYCKEREPFQCKFGAWIYKYGRRFCNQCSCKDGFARINGQCQNCMKLFEGKRNPCGRNEAFGGCKACEPSKCHLGQEGSKRCYKEDCNECTCKIGYARIKGKCRNCMNIFKAKGKSCGRNEVYGRCKFCEPTKCEREEILNLEIEDICENQKCNNCTCKKGFARINGQCQKCTCGDNEVLGGCKYCEPTECKYGDPVSKGCYKNSCVQCNCKSGFARINGQCQNCTKLFADELQCGENEGKFRCSSCEATKCDKGKVLIPRCTYSKMKCHGNCGCVPGSARIGGKCISCSKVWRFQLYSN